MPFHPWGSCGIRRPCRGVVGFLWGSQRLLTGPADPTRGPPRTAECFRIPVTNLRVTQRHRSVLTAAQAERPPRTRGSRGARPPMPRSGITRPRRPASWHRPRHLPVRSSTAGGYLLDADVKDMIVGQLDTAQERSAVILHGHGAPTRTSRQPVRGLAPPEAGRRRPRPDLETGICGSGDGRHRSCRPCAGRRVIASATGLAAGFGECWSLVCRTARSGLR
jgi:hypothetical protein